jgi:hypothetical protein
MKKISLAILLFLCSYATLYSQNPYSIKGVVADTANNSKLLNATISILNAKDSTLYKFTRANAAGSFAVNPMKKGNFIILVTYPDYADYVSFFAVDSAKNNINFGQINMKLKATLLKEVLIKGQGAAIKIKGDTTEFNAASYTIQPNDKVEDLLKKLPGIQIDKDGKITAQGKTVPKVLVDGEEFFGDDPTLVTKNLRADMVDKVQLFEKASDQATFTGVDDGKKTPTINIKLKEDKKNGYFGKAMGGIGTDEFYQGQLMFNRFKGKQKFSLYGTSSNTGKTGLSWQDSEKYGSSGSDIQFIDGGITIFGSGGDELSGGGGSYYGEGIPQAHNGGAHYDTKWNSDKESLNTNYKLGSLAVNINKNTIEQNNLGKDINNYNTDLLSDTYLFRQKLDFIYQIKLDTASNLRISADGTLKNTTNKSNSKRIGTRGDNTLLNTSDRIIDNKGNEQLFNFSALYTKRLKKPGRNYSLTVGGVISEKESEGFLDTKNYFYNPSQVLTSSQIVDQFKENTTESRVFSTNLTYSEPITKKLSLVMNYGINLNNSTSVRETYDASTPGNYDKLNKTFSNDFEATQFANQAGAIFNYKAIKTNLNFGTRINAISFNQYDAYADTRLKRSFINWMPQARYQYRFSQQKSLSVNYNGNTTQPSITQLQTVRVNDDPLNEVIGNETLKPSYRSYIGVNYNSYKVLSGESIYVSGNYGFTLNQIVNSVTTDITTGKSLFQAINLKEKTPMSYNLYIDYGRKVKFLGGNIGAGLSSYANTNYSYINNDINQNTTKNSNFNLSFYKSKEKKYDIRFYGGPTYTIEKTKTSFKTVNSEGWGANASTYFAVFLPGKVNITSDVNYTYTGETIYFGESFSQVIVNTSLNKTFFKGDNLKLSLSGNDLLNQNRGFRRTSIGNSITQNSYNNIKRYFMFSVTWDFNKMGGAPTKK